MFKRFKVHIALAGCILAFGIWSIPKADPKDDLQQTLNALRQEVNQMNRLKHDDIASKVAADLKPSLAPGSCATEDLEQKLRRLSAYVDEVEAAIARADRRLSR
jgi:hypothetical protein